MQSSVTLLPLQPADREQFILDNQRAFKYGATEEFGSRDNHFEEDGEIISRATIEASISGANAETYRILLDGTIVGGAVISVVGNRGELELLFVNPEVHSRGVGYAAWCLLEKMHPEVTVWETTTPYFEKRNIHFYVNRCGFHIVEYYNSHHPASNNPDFPDSDNSNGPDNNTPDNDNNTLDNANPDNANPDNDAPDNDAPDNDAPDNANPDNANPDNDAHDNDEMFRFRKVIGG